jgi:anti-sigma factor RsiW
MKQIMACADWIEKISAGVDGELSLPERKSVADHLAGCEECRAMRETFLRDRARFVAAFDAATAEVSLTARVLERLPRRPPRRGRRDWAGAMFTFRPVWAWAGVGATMVLLCVVATGVFFTTLSKKGRDVYATVSERRAMTDETTQRMSRATSWNQPPPATMPPAAAESVAMSAPQPASEAGSEGEMAKAAGGGEESKWIVTPGTTEGAMAGAAGSSPGGPPLPSSLSPSESTIPTSPPAPAYEARLHLRVADAQAALLRAERLVEEYRGVIVQSNFPTTGKAEKLPVAAKLTGRVPRDKFWPLLQDLDKLGKVLSRQVGPGGHGPGSSGSPAAPGKPFLPPAGRVNESTEAKQPPASPLEASSSAITVYFSEASP